jgi:DeoR/GlpR family transcriptional regulator of sugar metabolism
VEAEETRITEDLFPVERQQRMREWFAVNVSASIQELSRMLNTSISTVRRDLDALAAEGLIRRTHGGAVRTRMHSALEPSVEEARHTAVEEKRAIALEAVKRLEPGLSIFLDTGSTPVELAKAIAESSIPLTVVTQDLQIAHILGGMHTNIRLIVPGGLCRPKAYTLLGDPGIEFIKSLRCDIFFLSSAAVDFECISDTYLDLVRLKSAMIDASRKTCLLIDSSRMASRAIYRVAGIDRINEIITDVGTEEAVIQGYAEMGITVTRAVPEELLTE